MINVIIAALLSAVAFLVALFSNEHKKREAAEEKAAVATVEKKAVEIARVEEKKTAEKVEVIKEETTEIIKEVEKTPEEEQAPIYNQLIDDFNAGK